jgi:hypothetical protein
MSGKGTLRSAYLWVMKSTVRISIASLLLASCATDTRYAYIGEADMRQFGNPLPELVLYTPNGSDSMVLALDGPQVEKSIYETSQFYGLKRSRTEAESRWFTYTYLNGNGNIHIGLSSDGVGVHQQPLPQGRSLLQIQPDISGGAFFSVYCQNGALLPPDPSINHTLTHIPIDTIRHASGNYTGYYRLERTQPWPGWLHWTAVWIRPGQVLAGLETAGGSLYLSR